MVKEHATVTIRDAGKMTKRGREHIAEWLRDLADRVEADGKDYAPQFTSRYQAG